MFIVFLSEIILRLFNLVSDIPQRIINNDNGIQKFKMNQSGYYVNNPQRWKVNDYGWLGVSKLNSTLNYSIIGDSFIENIMNPIECNQGYILSQMFNDKIGFIEAGRSGVNFIESLVISKYLEENIDLNFHLIYVQNEDFQSSIRNYQKYEDQLQIDINNNELFKPSLKYPTLKKIVYNFKTLYYLYLRFPIFVEPQNKSEIDIKLNSEESFDFESYIKLINYSKSNFTIENKLIIFHPDSNQRLIDLLIQNGFKVIELKKNGIWRINNNDSHWSCFGHNQVANQVYKYLIKEKVKKYDF